MLNKTKLKQLRKEIILNSIFVNDYKNTLYIDKQKACEFFEGYTEYLCELANENNFDGDIISIIRKYDNITNLYNYYLSFEVDPLPQNYIYMY